MGRTICKEPREYYDYVINGSWPRHLKNSVALCKGIKVGVPRGACGASGSGNRPTDSLAAYSQAQSPWEPKGLEKEIGRRVHSRVQPVALALLLSLDPHKVDSWTWNSEPAASWAQKKFWASGDSIVSLSSARGLSL